MTALADARADAGAATSRSRRPRGERRRCSCCSATTRRLPRALRERGAGVPGGASVPLTLESWRADRGRLDGWMSHAAKRCVAALVDGRPAPPAVLERSTRPRASRRSCSRRATTRRRSRRSPGCEACWRPRGAPRGRARARPRCRRSAPIRSACPSSTRFLADGERVGRAGRARAAAGDPRAARARRRPGGALGRDRRAARRCRTSAAS